MQDLISVIIPVYKAEQYLARCLDSVIAQSYQNIEIILVDDGSPDNSGKICDDYKNNDSRITVLHKQNGGAASARNAGLDKAKGKYVTFVDSDDVLPKESIELLYSAIIKHKCGYVAGICGFEVDDAVKNKITAEKVIVFANEPETLLNYIITSGSYSPYAKLYDMDIIDSNSLRFNVSHKCSEDSLFIRQYLKHCRSIALIPHVVYFYNTRNENSLSKKYYPDYTLYYADKLVALDELVETLDMPIEKKRSFLNQRAIHGLKIGVYHYLSGWNDEDDRRLYVERGVKALMPWLFISKPAKNLKLYRWWKKYSGLLEKGDINRFYKKARQEFIFYKRIQRLKDLIRKFK